MNIFIGCSSREEIDEKYFEESKNLINKISKNNNLVFGVSSHGLMNLTYEIFKKNKRKIIGITNESYIEEFKKVPCDEEYVIYSTLDRTKKVIELSDIFLFLPGGLGTYAEIFHIFEELRTYNINKKIIIYNLNNYYNKVIDILKKITKENFMDKELLKYVKIYDDETMILNEFKN